MDENTLRECAKVFCFRPAYDDGFCSRHMPEGRRVVEPEPLKSVPPEMSADAAQLCIEVNDACLAGKLDADDVAMLRRLVAKLAR